MDFGTIGYLIGFYGSLTAFACLGTWLLIFLPLKAIVQHIR